MLVAHYIDWRYLMKKLVIGILAHVDAGKTTLVESLYIRQEALEVLEE